MENKRSQFRLGEIARELGISVSTVSRALSGVGRVSEETRKAVLATAKRLHNQSDLASSSEVGRRLLGLLMPWYGAALGMGTSISTLGQEAVRQVSEAAGFGLLYSSFGGPVRTVADDMLDGASVAGVLLYRTKNEARMGQMMDARKIPHVFVYRDLSGTQLNYVGIDFRQAMRLAVEHCVETGNRRLGVLLGDLTFPSHQAFESGFREEASRLKAEVQPGWIHSGEVSEEGGYRMATALLKGRERPGAVICTSDKIALGVLRAIHEARVRIPQDIAVVSVDGTNATAFSNPALTAVRIPWPEMFTVATRMLIELIQNSGVIGQISVLMKCEIVVRESTVRAARSRKGKSAILT